MKKLFLTLSVTTITLFTIGCVPSSPPHSDLPSVVHHVKFANYSPDLLNKTNLPPEEIEIYLSETGARLTVYNDAGSDFPMYWFSDVTNGTEYMFAGPQDEAAVAILPDDHPQKQLKNTDSVISKIKSDKNISFAQLIYDDIFTIDPEYLNSSATQPYEIIVPYYENEIDPPVQRRYTINPETNTVMRMQLLDFTESGEPIVIEETTVTVNEDIPINELPADFFTLEGWKKDLPGDNFTIIEDTIFE